jgi:hypothetical protein
MDASDPLLEPRWVPRGFEIDHRGGELKIESSAASIGGKEHPASRVAIEPSMSLPRRREGTPP